MSENLDYPELVNLNQISDSTGLLTVIEPNSLGLNFEFQRVYFLHELKVNSVRGQHAHKKLKQFMYCPSGEIEIRLTSVKGIVYTYVLNSKSGGLFVPPGFWRDIFILKENSTLTVCASEPYLESDYIRNFDEFMKWRGE